MTGNSDLLGWSYGDDQGGQRKPDLEKSAFQKLLSGSSLVIHPISRQVRTSAIHEKADRDRGMETEAGRVCILAVLL